MRRRRLTSKRADSEVGPYTNTGIKLEFEEWLTSKKAGFPYNNVHRIAVSGVVDIEEGRTEVPALHRQDNQENHEAGASSRSQMLR